MAEIQPERVIHLAGQAYVPAAMEDPVGTFRVNILGGVAVLEAVRKMGRSGKGPTVLVVSTGEVYGRVQPPTRQPITEDTPLNPNNPYAASKAGIDLIAQQYGIHFGVNVIVVRPFNHAGPRQSPVFVCSDFGRQFAEIALGKRAPQMSVGNIDAQRDFTDVRDVVRAYWLLFERRTDDVVFNVCSGKSRVIREIIFNFEQIIDRKVEVVSEEKRIRSYDVPVVVGSYDRLRRATGWVPEIPFEQTLRDVFTYWKQRVAAGS